MKKLLKCPHTGAHYVNPREPDPNWWWLMGGADVVPDKRYLLLKTLAKIAVKFTTMLCPRIGKNLNKCPGTCMFYGYTCTADASNKFGQCPLYCLDENAWCIINKVSKQVKKHPGCTENG